jgi:hypothetical protein
VRVVVPPLAWVVAVPVTLPDASRITARSVPPACFWRSMVWKTRPEESRTTSRQVWAGEPVANAIETKAGRSIAFMRILTAGWRDSFDLDERGCFGASLLGKNPEKIVSRFEATPAFVPPRVVKVGQS